MGMIGSWEIESLSKTKRYLEYSRAYLQVSIDTCKKLAEQDIERTWPNACVVMMLAAHSIELFLKGAILSRSPNEKNLSSHLLSDLSDKYHTLFPETDYQFDMPFRTKYLGISEAEAALQKKDDELIPSIFFRYPIKKNPNVEWDGIHSFDPDTCLPILQLLKQDYARIRALLDNISHEGRND